jgi:hypothetical protein
METGPVQTFADVIRLWGSAREMADEIGVSDIVVRAWRRRGIPGEYWSRIVAVAQDKPFADLVTLELLASLGAQRKQAAA